MAKKKLYIIILIFLVINIFAQIGINTSSIENGITLQVESSNKGFLFPRIPLVSRTSTAPLATTIPTGTIVFNTMTSGVFPSVIIPGLHWWSSEDQQWTNFSTNINSALLKYTNSESSTNYNTNTLQNVKLFGSKIINESSSIYNVNSSDNSIIINRSGLYSISVLLSFDRENGGSAGRVSLSARVYVDGNPVGTEQVISPGYTGSINNNRGLFSHSFTEYLELGESNTITIKIKKTDGTYSGSHGSAGVKFLQNGDSSIVILRIR